MAGADKTLASQSQPVRLALDSVKRARKLRQGLETAQTERLATERKLDRILDDVRRAKLVEDGLLQSNSDTLEYVSRHSTLATTHTSSSRQVKVIRQARLPYSHITSSSNFCKRSTTSFWPKLRHRPSAIVPTHAAKIKANQRSTGFPSPRIRKQCTPSHPARHTRRGSYPLPNESKFRNPSQRRPNHTQNPVTTGRGLSKSPEAWISTSTIQPLTGAVLRIQPRPRLWVPSRTAAVSTT
jgi:hypothetical protein